MGWNARTTARQRAPWPVNGGLAGRLIREGGGSGTLLGDVEGWSPVLKASVDLVLNAPNAMALLWSDRLLQIGNDRFSAAFRVSPHDTLARPLREDSWRRGWAALERHCESALEGEASRGRIATGNRQEGDLHAAFSPVREEDGRVAGVLVSLTDDDDAPLSEPPSARRLRSDFMDELPAMTWLADRDGAWVAANEAWDRFTGLGTVESLGFQWFKMVDSRDLDMLTTAWREALEMSSTRLDQTSLDIDHRLYCAVEARYRWVRHRARPVLDDEGLLAGWIGAISDIDDLMRDVERHVVEAAELQRQIRNAFAVMRSMIRRTAESAHSVDDYVLHLDGRFGSFARVQAKLMRMPDMTLDLEELVLDELASYAALATDRCRVAGPPVRLRAKLAEALGMVFHELATNAAKFGALATEDGRIDVSWEVTHPLTDEGGARVLSLIWRESGPVATRPSARERRGYATTLIEDIITYEFDASAAIDVLADGVTCRLILPLTDGIAPEEAPSEL